ncbi:MAG: aminotransferase class III-fold pyridoxal phosphate-dependent enzyme, partial [Nitrospirota bacterium]
AVIMEPVGVVEPEDSFLEEVKDITHENGALLIFDEIITGFRLSLGGAQEYYKVIPDLACFGKAMANGMPISAVVGRREIMEIFEEIFFSFTFGGEVLSLAASIATINEIKGKDVIKHIWRLGRILKDGYNELSKKHGLESYTSCIGLPPRTVITFTPHISISAGFKDAQGNESLEMKTLFQQETIKRGILFSGSQNICYSHSDEDIDYTLKVYDEAFKVLSRAIEDGDFMKYIEGEIVQPVFRKA